MPFARKSIKPYMAVYLCDTCAQIMMPVGPGIAAGFIKHQCPMCKATKSLNKVYPCLEFEDIEDADIEIVDPEAPAGPAPLILPST